MLHTALNACDGTVSFTYFHSLVPYIMDSNYILGIVQEYMRERFQTHYSCKNRCFFVRSTALFLCKTLFLMRGKCLTFK